VGALDVSRALVPVTLVTLFIVALQLSILSSLRFAGVVVMLVWLWPLAMGLAGFTVLSVWSALVAGVFFDTHAVTPFGLTAAVGMLLAYGASRLGKEGVGDLDSAAWWVTPIIAAGGGFVAPLLYVAGAFLTLHFSLWRGSTPAMMVVNAVAFLVLARPVSHLARAVGNVGVRVRR
jgi:cell shape-determining protein MreD